MVRLRGLEPPCLTATASKTVVYAIPPQAQPVRPNVAHTMFIVHALMGVERDYHSHLRLWEQILYYTIWYYKSILVIYSFSKPTDVTFTVSYR